MKIEVRKFERRNLKRVVEIERGSFGRDAWPAEAFLDYWRDSPELFLTVRLGRRIAGYSITQVDWRGADLESIAADLESIAIDPHYRGRGLAQALLDTTLSRAGVLTLRLMVSVSNDAALGFYRSYGFVRTRRVKNYYGAGRDAWRMRLTPGDRRSRPKQQRDK